MSDDDTFSFFTCTPLEPFEAGRWHVVLAGTEVKWTTFARDADDLREILKRQRAAWERRLLNVKPKRGEAMKRAIHTKYVANRGAST